MLNKKSQHNRYEWDIKKKRPLSQAAGFNMNKI